MGRRGAVESRRVELSGPSTFRMSVGMSTQILELYPNSGTTRDLDGTYLAHELRTLGTPERPFVYANFVSSLDGRIAVEARHEVGIDERPFRRTEGAELVGEIRAVEVARGSAVGVELQNLRRHANAHSER